MEKNIRLIKGNKGTGMALFSTELTFRLKQLYGKKVIVNYKLYPIPLDITMAKPIIDTE